MNANPPDHSAYLKELGSALAAIAEKDISGICDILVQARERGKTIYIFGNGDSASNATHFAADLSKGTAAPGGKRFRIQSLALNIPLMTAWTNDVSYESVFKEQLEGILMPGDVVIGISGSGNSPNVLRAIEYANAMGAMTIGLTAFDGGKLAKLARTCIVAKTHNMEIAEDVHWVIGHLLKNEINRRQEQEGRKPGGNGAGGKGG